MRKLPQLNLPVKLDLGCGQNKLSDHTGMDFQDYGQEILWDINHGIPLPNNSVSKFYSSHFFEHLKKEELPNVFLEIHRVCINDAPVTIIVPHADTHQAHYLCHYTYWNEQMIKGIIEDSFGRIELLSTSRESINFIMNMKVKK